MPRPERSERGVIASPQPVSFASRIAWVGHLTNNVGVLTCEQSTKWGTTLYRLKNSDLTQNNAMLNLTHTVRAEPTDQTMTNCHDATLVELSADHYFSVMSVTDQQQQKAGMFGAALNTVGGSRSSITHLQTQPRVVVDSIFNVNGTINAMGVTGMAFPNVTPSDYMFDAVTAAWKPTKDFMNQLLVAGRPVGNKFATLYAEMGNTLNVRIGTVPDLEPASALTLPISGLTTGELPLNNGSVRWTTGATAHLLAAGPTQSNTGINFLWYDADGAVHARQTKMNTLLPMVNNIQSADIAAVTPPSSSFASFVLAWTTKDQSNTTSVYYGRISCTQ